MKEMMNAQEALAFQRNIENHAVFIAWGGHYTLSYLQELETLKTGKHGELKIRDGSYLVWLQGDKVIIEYNQEERLSYIYAEYSALVF